MISLPYRLKKKKMRYVPLVTSVPEDVAAQPEEEELVDGSKNEERSFFRFFPPRGGGGHGREIGGHDHPCLL